MIKKFYILIIDCGWPSVAHEVLQKSLKTFKTYLSKKHEVMIFSEKESIEFLRKYPEDLGRDPMIVITHVNPKEMVSKKDKEVQKKIDGVKIDLGVVKEEDNVLKYLVEICKLINHPKFVSDIAWDERKEMIDFIIKDIAGNFFTKVLEIVA